MISGGADEGAEQRADAADDRHQQALDRLRQLPPSTG